MKQLLLRNFVYPVAILAGLAFSGWVLWQSYRLNFVFFFYDGLAGIIAFLCLAKWRWRASALVNMTANTLILLAVLLPLADAIYALSLKRARARTEKLAPKERIYSYEVAKADPVQFKIWWDRFVKEWWKLADEITIPDPDKKLPFKLKPGSSGNFFGGEIQVNSLGFRDREFAVEKGDKYRIVAIGESTTMGITIREEGQPWPGVLEELIRGQLTCDRPIEVINAGVAVYNLHHNLIRVKQEVLRLKPDMILSYHGYNGFHFLDETMWDVNNFPVRETPPKLIERPLTLLEQFEYRIRLIKYKRKEFKPELPPETVARLRKSVLNSPYAQLHEELISIARTNQIKLVLLSYNMSVTRRSPHEITEFYAAGFPDVRYRMQANLLQTYLLEELAQRHPDVLFVDTSRDLNGAHEKYIDLVHLTQAGKNQLAGNILDGIRPHLMQEPKLRCSEPLAQKP